MQSPSNSPNLHSIEYAEEKTYIDTVLRPVVPLWRDAVGSKFIFIDFYLYHDVFKLILKQETKTFSINFEYVYMRHSI